MHIDIVPNRGSRPTYLLRESIREGSRVFKRTLANLSALSEAQIEGIRALLRGEQLAPVEQRFEVAGSLAHGHVQAVCVAMQRLGFPALLNARASRERDLVCAMVAARVLAPRTKLATTRWWHTTTLGAEFGVSDAGEDDLYAAMDWLLDRQGQVEKKLALRHLSAGGLVLYDLSSSYFEGECCPLAHYGHNRDGKRGKLQVNYGLVSAPGGCPVAVSVYEGNTADVTTLLPQVQRIRSQFGIERLVIVGDRGMISHKAIGSLQGMEGIDWITALKSAQIRTLLTQGALQMDLFDERNLAELTHPEFPGERLVACRNPALAKLRAQKRKALLQATVEALEKVRASITAKRLRSPDQIGVRVGRVVNQYKVAKHIELDIGEGRFEFRVREDSVAQEAALDGIYVLRTGLPAERMDAPEVVRSYKSLSDVERAFRSLKTVDLKVRPIHHRLANRVRSHIFLCMLAYYVEWHMLQAWRELLFADEDQGAKRTRDPVAPAKRSASALDKALTRTLPDSTPVHSFQTLLCELSTIVRNTCRVPGAKNSAATFEVITTANAKQRRAFDLLNTIRV
jgi:Transposase DDE domain